MPPEDKIPTGGTISSGRQSAPHGSAPVPLVPVPLTVSRAALLNAGSDEHFRQLVHRMLAFSAQLETVRSAFGAMIGLSGIQYTVLISIAHLQGDQGVGIKRVAAHLCLSGSFVTIVGGQLVKLDLVEKTTDRHDRRRVRLTVTDDGRWLLADLAPAQRKVNDLLFEPLASADFERVGTVFGALVRSGTEAVGLVEYLAGASGPHGGKGTAINQREADA